MKVYGTDAKSNTQTGIEDIVEDANAAVEYFNLNGIRVANPETASISAVPAARLKKCSSADNLKSSNLNG